MSWEREKSISANLYARTKPWGALAETDVASAKQWLDNFARTAESSETLDYLVGVIDDRIVDSLPEFLDPTLRSELHASTRAHWKGFLAVVTRDSIEVQPARQYRGPTGPPDLRPGPHLGTPRV